MGGGKSGGGSSTTTTQGPIRYAPYLEAAHSALLDHEGSDEPEFSFMDVFNATLMKHPGFTDEENEVLVASPYYDYEQIDIDEGFFGMTVDDPTVTYEIKNFPSLWDMFGKFMAGLDVHDLWGQIYEDVIQGPEIENVVSAQSVLLQDDIDTNVMPKFVAGMRDINSVQATTFVIGKAIIQDAHVKSVNKFSSQIRLHALNISNEQWKAHLVWDERVIKIYSELFGLYYGSKREIDKANADFLVKDYMWNLNLFENARGILSAMAGGAATSDSNTKGPQPSQLSQSIGGAATGAAAGYMITEGTMSGGIIGGLIGLGLSFL